MKTNATAIADLPPVVRTDQRNAKRGLYRRLRWEKTTARAGPIGPVAEFQGIPIPASIILTSSHNDRSQIFLTGGRSRLFPFPGKKVFVFEA
jgi:hypothetical protein